MSKPPTKPLGTVVTNHDSRRVPLAGRDRELRPGPYPYYGAAGIIDYVDQPIFTGLHLLVGEDGSVVREDGTPFAALADGAFWVNNHAHVLTGQTDDDTRYIYYALKNTNVRGWVTGAVQPKLNQSNLNQIPIPYPSENVRRGIVSALRALDDKLDHNCRTSRALEGIARTIFKAWFLDFEPVKAKAVGAGSFPSMPQAAFEALSDRFADTPIGPVPKGWNVQTVAEIMEVNPTRRIPRGSIAAYLDMSNMPTRGHAPDTWIRREAGSGVRFTNGDTLVARITPCLENGKTAFVDFLADQEVGWGSTEYVVLRPGPPMPDIFAYLLARSDGFRAHAIQNMSGTSGRQRVPSESIGRYLLAVPPPAILREFGATVDPLFAMSSRVGRESRLLAGLRDYLLPKLLSGAVRVEAANA